MWYVVFFLSVGPPDSSFISFRSIPRFWPFPRSPSAAHPSSLCRFVRSDLLRAISDGAISAIDAATTTVQSFWSSFHSLSREEPLPSVPVRRRGRKARHTSPPMSHSILKTFHTWLSGRSGGVAGGQLRSPLPPPPYARARDLQPEARLCARQPRALVPCQKGPSQRFCFVFRPQASPTRTTSTLLMVPCYILHQNTIYTTRDSAR